jgi:hypothetical protein
LHLAINSFVQVCAHATVDDLYEDILHILQMMISFYPESISRRDGTTRLYPFLQAAARAHECATLHPPVPEDLSLSITYELLRENPTLLRQSHA